jgi:hypothetical protein
MRRYYFDLVDGSDVALDEEGIELPDVQAAQEEAAAALAALVNEMRQTVNQKNLIDLAIDVRDNAGLVMRVRFDFVDRTVQ